MEGGKLISVLSYGGEFHKLLWFVVNCILWNEVKRHSIIFSSSCSNFHNSRKIAVDGVTANLV